METQGLGREIYINFPEVYYDVNHYGGRYRSMREMEEYTKGKPTEKIKNWVYTKFKQSDGEKEAYRLYKELSPITQQFITEFVPDSRRLGYSRHYQKEIVYLIRTTEDLQQMMEITGIGVSNPIADAVLSVYGQQVRHYRNSHIMAIFPPRIEDTVIIPYNTEQDIHRHTGRDTRVIDIRELMSNEVFRTMMNLDKLLEYLGTVVLGSEGSDIVEEMLTHEGIEDYIKVLGKIGEDDEEFTKMLARGETHLEILFKPIKSMNQTIKRGKIGK